MTDGHAVNGADRAGWDFGGEPAVLGGGVVTLVEGSTFCISGRAGDMVGGAQGLFVRDTRVLSRWRLQVDGGSPEPLTVMPGDPFRARFVARLRPGARESETGLLVERDRSVGDGMREDIRIRNLGRRLQRCTVVMEVGADFADLFAVKEGRVRPRGEISVAAGEGVLHLRHLLAGRTRDVRVRSSSDELVAELRRFTALLELGPYEEWRTTIDVTVGIDGAEQTHAFAVDGHLEHSAPALRLSQWRTGSAQLTRAVPSLVHTVRQSLTDLGSLRIRDPHDGASSAVAAGAPWFMALFGRDSLLSSYMALPLDASLALGTLRALARLQGHDDDPLSEEEPGRILHETRFGTDTELVLGRAGTYYGSVDATPLFVLLLGELRRWGLAPAEVDRLLPHADRALDWIVEHGDRDGDGFVEYARRTDQGLVNQGWKDSWDGVNFADGSLATPPIALCEVQGYVYAAYRARAHFAREAGDDRADRRWTDRAEALKAAFNEAFWLPDRGWYAIALDGDKRPVDALASNMGHCLWTGIVDTAHAAVVADALLSPQMFSGWGVRTLAATMGAYNPMSYHNGSVWPHDNALVVAGLMRYGFVEQAQHVATAILEAAEAFGGRLPELFCGLDRADYPAPVPYPTSCSPQAWASAAPIQLLRSLLRLDPWVPYGKVWVDPALPQAYADLRLEDVPLGERRLTIDVRDGAVSTSLTSPRGSADGLSILHEPRPPMAAPR